MSNPDDADPDGPLWPEAEAKARLLTAADLQRIDDCLLSHASDRWQKVARIIGLAMRDLDRQLPYLPDGSYTLRIKHLVASGAIEAVGDLNRIRYSEVRLTGPKPTGPSRTKQRK
jgi:hypothetical protein